MKDCYLDVGLPYERLAQIADARQARGKRYPASARRFFNAKLDTQLLSLP